MKRKKSLIVIASAIAATGVLAVGISAMLRTAPRPVSTTTRTPTATTPPRMQTPPHAMTRDRPRDMTRARAVERLSLANLPKAAAADPVLRAWLEDWCVRARDGAAVPDAQRRALQSVAERTALPAATLLSITQAIRRHAPDQLDVVGPLASAVARRGQSEATEAKAGSLGYRDRLYDLLEARKLLWACIMAGRVECVQPQLDLATFMAQCEPGNDPTLRAARVRGSIHAAECLTILGRPDEAVAELRKLKSARLDAEQTASVAAAEGVALGKAHRYEEAITPLKLAITRDDPKQSGYALQLLIISLIEVGRTNEAREYYARWLETRMPNATPENVNAMALTIETGEVVR